MPFCGSSAVLASLAAAWTGVKARCPEDRGAQADPIANREASRLRRASGCRPAAAYNGPGMSNLRDHPVPYRLFGLTTVAAVALLLRLWGLGFDLPYIFHPDEPDKIAMAQRMFATGDLNPH